MSDKVIDEEVTRVADYIEIHYFGKENATTYDTLAQELYPDLYRNGMLNTVRKLRALIAKAIQMRRPIITRSESNGVYYCASEQEKSDYILHEIISRQKALAIKKAFWEQIEIKERKVQVKPAVVFREQVKKSQKDLFLKDKPAPFNYV